MTAAEKTHSYPSDNQRRGIYRKIAVARKQLAMADDVYRDMLFDRYGARSATQLTVKELEDLVAHFRRLGFKPKRAGGKGGKGARPLAQAPEAKKARALWLSLYHLGVVRDHTEWALTRFGERQTGTAALQWIRGDWARVIEALKDMAARPVEKGGAGVDWSSYPVLVNGVVEHREDPRARVMEAQWRRLAALGWTKVASTHALAGWLQAAGYVTGRAGHVFLDPDTADRAIAHLGGKIRSRLQAGKDTAP